MHPGARNVARWRSRLDRYLAGGLRELQGARERMLLDALEDDVRVRRETGASTPPALQRVEQDLITELRHVVELYQRTAELVTRPPPI